MIPLADPARTGDALAAARELLPAWVVWGRTIAPPVLVFLAQFSVGGWTVALMEHKAGPQSGLHWTERARLVTNTRSLLQVLALCLIVPAVAILGLLSSPFDVLPDGVTTLVTLFLLLLSGQLGSLWVRTRLAGQHVPWKLWCGETLASCLLFQPALLVAVACVVLCGRRPGPLAIGLVVLGTLVILGHGRGPALRLLRALGLVRPFDAQARIGKALEGVRIFEVDLGMANALALQGLGIVLVTRRLVDLLDPAELEAVLQHELGHMAEPRRVQALRRLALVPIVLLAWLRPLMGWLGTAGGLLTFYLSWLVPLFVGRKWKKWEEHADLHAHDHIEDGQVHARALEKIYAYNLFPAVTSKARTHPHLYDRMLAAGLQPDYPRPAATRSRVGWGIAVGLVLGFWLGGVHHWTQPDNVPPEERAVLRALAFGGYADEHLDTLADLREECGDNDAAARFRAAADEVRSLQPQDDTGSQR